MEGGQSPIKVSHQPSLLDLTSVQTIPRSNIFGMDTIAKPISNIWHGEFLQLAEEQEAVSPLPQQDHSSNHS